MVSALHRTVCWVPLWNPAHEGVGLEHLTLRGRSADSVVVAIDGVHGPFRLDYRLRWNAGWQLREARLALRTAAGTRALHLQSDGRGRWRRDGAAVAALDGCEDIDIWPTPFTNSFPIRRVPLAVGERREFRMAWVNAIELSVQAQAQAYTCVAERRYRFESLDGSGFRAELPVDADGLVEDYPGLFRRVRP